MLVFEFREVAKVEFVHIADPNNRSLQTSRFGYRLIQIMTPGPKQLVLITASKGKHMLCLWQLYKQFVQDYVSYSTFMAKVSIYNNRKELQLVQHADRRMLIRLGAVQARAVKVGIVTCSVAYHSLQACGIPNSTLDAIQAISSNPAGLMVLPLPQHIMQSCAQPATNPDELQMLGPLPVTIPVYLILTDPMANRKYGLWFTRPALAALRPLSLQMDELKSFSMDPVRLNRPFQSHSSSTWNNNKDCISLFLGHIHWRHNVMQPTLQQFLDPALLVSYTSFKVTSKHSINTIKHFLSVAKVVLFWWQTKPGGQHDSLRAAISWLETMSLQVQQLQHSQKDLCNIIFCPLCCSCNLMHMCFLSFSFLLFCFCWLSLFSFLFFSISFILSYLFFCFVFFSFLFN